MRKNIIGITGHAGHGKDTLARALAAELGDSATLGFADPIRSIADALGLDVFDREKKESRASLRFEHFELALVDAMVHQLGAFVGEDDLCDLYAEFVTTLRGRGFLTTGRQDVLKISPRRFCQLLGTEGGRAIRPSFWVDVFRARAAKSRARYVLAPDVRYVNEAVACDLLIGIHRPAVLPVRDHGSEKEITALVWRADTVFYNDGGLALLGRYAKVVAEGIKEGRL